MNMIEEQLKASGLLNEAKGLLNEIIGKDNGIGVNIALLKQAIQAYAEAKSYFDCQIAYFNWGESVSNHASSARKRMDFIRSQLTNHIGEPNESQNHDHS